MTVAASTAEFRGGIKPVGECLPILVNAEAKTVATGAPFVRNYDFVLNADYDLTALEVSKVTGAAPTDVAICVEVLRYPPDAAEDVNLDQIALATLEAAAAKGTKAIAGVLTGSLAIGNDVDGTKTNQFRNGDATDPLVEVAANVPATGTNSSIQRLRVRLTAINTGSPGSDTGSLSVFILASFCRFSPYKNAGAEELTTIDVA